MNGVAPPARAIRASPAPVRAGTSKVTTSPSYEGTAGRGRSAGRASSAGASASACRQYAACRPAADSGSAASPSNSRCHSAKSAYCTGRGAKAGSAPADRAVYARSRSASSGPADPSSVAMWCTRTTSRWSSGAARSSVTRTGGSAARSKTCPPAWTASSSSRSAGTSRTLSATPARSAGTTTWYGSPSSSRNTVRRLSCRATRSLTAAARAAVSTGPLSRTASGTL